MLTYEDLIAVMPQLVPMSEDFQRYFETVKPHLQEREIFDSFDDYLQKRLQFSRPQNDYVLINYANRSLDIKTVMSRYNLTQPQILFQIIKSSINEENKLQLIKDLQPKLTDLLCVDVLFDFDKNLISAFNLQQLLEFCIEEFDSLKNGAQILKFCCKDKNSYYQETKPMLKEVQVQVLKLLVSSNLQQQCAVIFKECSNFDQLFANVSVFDKNDVKKKFLDQNCFDLSLQQLFKLLFEFNQELFKQFLSEKEINEDQQMEFAIKSGLKHELIIQFCIQQQFPLKKLVLVAIENECDERILNSFKTLLELEMFDKVDVLGKRVYQLENNIQKIINNIQNEADMMQKTQ